MKKYTKAQCLMFMKDKLEDKGGIDREDIKKTLKISDQTFHRYIKELKTYYSIFYFRKSVSYFPNMDEYVLFDDEAHAPKPMC